MTPPPHQDRPLRIPRRAVLVGLGVAAAGGVGLVARHRRVLSGINLAGAEASAEPSRLPGKAGTDYRYPSAQDLAYIASRGHRLMRLPFRWERVQPALSHPLDPSEVARLAQTVSQAGALGLRVLLDLHNFGRYLRSSAQGGETLVLGQSDGRLGREHLADVWSRLSKVFAGQDAVVGYGLMNEPHDLPAPKGESPAGQWELISQYCVDALRARGDHTSIYVSGYSWSGAAAWPDLHPRPWVRDPRDRVVYEAHYYFDHDRSGAYDRSFDQEQEDALSAGYASLAARARDELGRFTHWCSAAGVEGFVGEVGWPNDSPMGWNTVGAAVYQLLEAEQVGSAYWAAAQWYGDSYPLSAYRGEPLSTPTAPAAVIERH